MADRHARAAAASAAGLAWLRLADPLFKELDTSGTHAPLAAGAGAGDARSGRTTRPGPRAARCSCRSRTRRTSARSSARRRRSASARVGPAPRGRATRSTPRAPAPPARRSFQVPLLQGPSIQDLSSRDVPLIALATDGPDDRRASRSPIGSAWCPGVEGPGLPDHLRDGPAPADPDRPGRRVAQRGDGDGRRALRLEAGAAH